MAMGQVCANAARSIDELDGVIVVLLDAGCDGEYVGVENDIVRGHAHCFCQQFVRTGADFDLAVRRISLALLIEGHDHHRRTIGKAGAGMGEEAILAFLQRDGINDQLALHAFQPGLDHIPFGAVDHHRNAGNVRLGGNEVEEGRHRLHTVKHTLIHVDVDDLRTVLDLLARDLKRSIVVAGLDQRAKARRAGHVGTFTNIDKAG